MLEDGYNNVSIPGWCPSTSRPLHSSQGKWAESGAFVTETGFWTNSDKVPAGTYSRVHTPGPGVQHTEDDFVTSPGQGPSNKGSGSQIGLLPTCRGVMRLLGLTNFASMALPLARLHSHPHTILAQGKVTRLQPICSKDWSQTHEGLPKLMHWWHTFKPQLKSLCKPLIEEAVTRDASKEGYGGQMNNLPFRGRCSARNGRNTHINILQLKKVWMAYHKFEETMRGKTVSLQTDNTMAVAYVLMEGGLIARP